MSETTEKLVGIKQVLLPEFKAAEEAGTTKGYMWFVRDNNLTLHNYIYLGSRLYGEAEIEVPLNSVITNILSDNSIVVTKTSSEDGTTVELKVNLDPNGGLSLTENGLQVDMSKFISQSELDKVKDDVKTVNDNLVTSINNINQNVADGFNTINGGINNEIRPAIEEVKKMVTDETERALAAETELDSKISEIGNVDEIKEEIEEQIKPELEKAVKYKEFADNRKTIELANYDTISGLMTDGLGVNLAMISKWDVADFGSTKLPINFNGSKDRPTYNDTKEIALINDVNDSLAAVNDDIKNINDIINNNVKPSIEDLKENKVSYVEAEKEGKKYKVIQLDNYANLVGEGADELSGQTFNIAMVSKWNKVDLGSSALEINLNGKADRPTYNDTKEIALIEDVNGKISSVELVQDVDNQLHYELMVDGVIKGDINIPKDQFLKNVEYDDVTKELVFTFDTSDGEKVTKVNIGELVDTYEAGNGLELNGNIFSVKLDPSSQSYIQVTSDGIKIVGIDEAISSINENISNANEKISANELLIATKVDKVEGKGLSEEDFTSALKAKLEGLENYNDEEIKNEITSLDVAYKAADNALSERIIDNEQAIAAKVDKVEGKGLSEEDFTSTLKTKLEGLENYDDEQVKSDIVSLDGAYKEADSALSERILSNEQAIATKVDKVDGKGLSTNDFTNALKTKLEGLENFDSTDIDDKINNLQTGLTNQTVLQATNYKELSEKIDSEITRATNVENDIQRDINNILDNGLKLKQGSSIKAYIYDTPETTEPSAPVNIVQVKDNNNLEVGSNVCQLVLKTKGSPLVSLNDGKAVNLLTSEDAKDMVSYKDFIFDGQNRKTIELANNDTISGLMTDGLGVNLVMVNKWNVADFGSPQLPFNINTPKDTRVTVQEQGQSGEDAHKIAYLSDVDELKAIIIELQNRVSRLEEEVNISD